MRARSTALVMVLAASCATVAPAAIDRVAGAGYDGVIFSAEYAQQKRYGADRPMWTPTRAIVATFERQFVRWLRERRLPVDAVRQPKFARQYLGMFEHATGRKLLYVRFLGPAYSPTNLVLPDFQSVPADASEGEVWFDPATREIVDAPDRSRPPSPPEPQPLPNGEPTPPAP